MLDFGLGAGTDADGGLLGRGPFGLIVRDGGEHVGIDYEAVAGQAPAQHLDQDVS